MGGMSERSRSDAPAPARSAPPAAEPVWHDEQRETVVAVFGDTARSGAWYPPERLVAVAGFGNVKLDFRDADLPGGPTEVLPFAVFGNVELVVPRHLDVELNGVSLFGKIQHRSDRKAGRKLFDRVLGKAPAQAAAVEDDEDRWIVVRAWAVFGNVRVTVVEP
jgi:predicted membrane protein